MMFNNKIFIISTDISNKYRQNNIISKCFSKERYKTHAKSCNSIFVYKNQQSHLCRVNFRNYVLFIMYNRIKLYTLK